MSKKIENLQNHREARDYVQNVFMKAEDHALLMFECAAWAVGGFLALRNKLENGGEPISMDFPDPKMRNFEQLGKELDQHFKDVNLKIPLFVKEDDDE